MDKENKGLYQKYKVERNDGKEITTGSFVLELKDPYARTAILAYADELEKAGEKKDLIYDLRSWVSRYQTPEEKKSIITFKRLAVIGPNEDSVSSEAVYIIPPENNGVLHEYTEDGSIILDAIVSVNTKPFTEYQLEKSAKENDKEYQAVISIASFVINEYMDTPEYVSIEQMWEAKKDFYTNTFKQDEDKLWLEITKQFEKN